MKFLTRVDRVVLDSPSLIDLHLADLYFLYLFIVKFVLVTMDRKHLWLPDT